MAQVQIRFLSELHDRFVLGFLVIIGKCCHHACLFQERFLGGQNVVQVFPFQLLLHEMWSGCLLACLRCLRCLRLKVAAYRRLQTHDTLTQLGGFFLIAANRLWAFRVALTISGGTHAWTNASNKSVLVWKNFVILRYSGSGHGWVLLTRMITESRAITWNISIKRFSVPMRKRFPVHSKDHPEENKEDREATMLDKLQIPICDGVTNGSNTEFFAAGPK